MIVLELDLQLEPVQKNVTCADPIPSKRSEMGAIIRMESTATLNELFSAPNIRLDDLLKLSITATLELLTETLEVVTEKLSEIMA